MDEAERPRGLLGARRDGRLRGVRQTRRRDVDRLLEERAVQGVWLVEQRQHVQPARHEQALERDFRAGHEVFNQELFGPLAAAGELWRGEDTFEASVGGDELLGIIRADHPATGGKPQRLEDARVASRRCEGPRVGVNRLQRELRHRDAGGRHQHALLVLVARGAGRRDGIARKAQRCGDRRLRDGGVVVHGDHPGDRMLSSEAAGRVGGALGVLEVQRQQAVGLRRLEGAGPLGRDRQLGAEPARGLDESGGAVGAGRKKKKDPGRGQITSSRRRSRGSHPRCGR